MTYEYLCSACQHAWEAEQPISEPAIKICPACGKEAAKRQVSGGAGFILKGGGWYADLYSSSSGKPAEAKGDADGKKGDADGKKGDAVKKEGGGGEQAAAKTDKKADSTSSTGDGGAKGGAGKGSGSTGGGTAPSAA